MPPIITFERSWFALNLQAASLASINAREKLRLSVNRAAFTHQNLCEIPATGHKLSLWGHRL